MKKHSKTFNHHNYTHYIQSAMDTAPSICLQRGVKVTEFRAKVLELIWQSQRSIGADTILEMVSAVSAK